MKLILFVIKIYKLTLSKALLSLFGNGCRFEPTCSEYAAKSIERFGTYKGIILTIKRLARCHPFSKASFDPVPEKASII